MSLGNLMRRGPADSRDLRESGSIAPAGTTAAYAGRVSELPISSPYRSTPDAPVSESERNQLSSRLNEAFTAGSLDADDYKTRLDRLFAAHTMGELLPVVEGLPPLQTYNSPAIVASEGGRPGELTESRSGNGLTLVTVGGVAVGVVLLAILFLLLF